MTEGGQLGVNGSTGQGAAPCRRRQGRGQGRGSRGRGVDHVRLGMQHLLARQRVAARQTRSEEADCERSTRVESDECQCETGRRRGGASFEVGVFFVVAGGLLQGQSEACREGGGVGQVVPRRGA